MKKLCLLLLLSFAASARAEKPQSPAPSQMDESTSARETVEAHAAPELDQKLTTQIELRAQEIPLDVERPAPIEISLGRLKVDGNLVQLVKTDNPFHLINQVSPERSRPAGKSVGR